jgi:hypothetical protein
MQIDSVELAARSKEELLRRNRIFKDFFKAKSPAWPKPTTKCLAGSWRTGAFWPSGMVPSPPMPSTSLSSSCTR